MRDVLLIGGWAIGMVWLVAVAEGLVRLRRLLRELQAELANRQTDTGALSTPEQRPLSDGCPDIGRPPPHPPRRISMGLWAQASSVHDTAPVDARRTTAHEGDL